MGATEWRLLRWSMIITTVLATVVSSFILTYTWSTRKYKAEAKPRQEIIMPADNIGQTPQKTLLR